MLKPRLILNIAFLLILFNTQAQNPVPPCGNDYGTTSDEANIIQQMRFGTVNDAVNAINQAKNSRGFSLGCPQSSYSYNSANYTEPLLTEVETVWNSAHKPAIEAYSIDCPRIGRYENNAALGAYYAMLAGYPVNSGVLGNIAEMMMAQQYGSSTVAVIVPEHEGVFGYIHVGSLNPCYPGGVVGSSVNTICSNIPQFCVDYNYGLFAGENFLIGDQYEPLSFYDGGMAYDHGWIGAHLVEAIIQQTDPSFKGQLKNSLVLAAKWAMTEYAVKNHNYTAKLIWILAQVYGWSGESAYKDALNEKLNRNLIPSVLMDANSDGLVDGTSPLVAFSDLTSVAQIPGRCWDGHNSLPWYNAMNAWAMTEAYVAFRDQGDTVRANELRPYVIAMLDNLAWEVNNMGVLDDQLGVRDLVYGLLIGIWKVARYESDPQPDWESAAWAYWNTGYFNAYSTHSVCVGLYLVLLSDTEYLPLASREDFGDIASYAPTNKLSLFPNPSANHVKLQFDNPSKQEFLVRITDLSGRLIFTQQVNDNELVIDLSGFQAGTYIVSLTDMKSHAKYSERLVITRVE